MTTEITPAKSWIKRHPILTGIGGLVILIIIISSLGGSKSSSTPTTSAPAKVEEVQAISITATKLAQAYIDNEVNADVLYKGKILNVSGSIKDIGKDILDTPYVTLESNPSDYFTGVQCMFEKGDEAKLATLNKGTQTTLQGKVSSKLGNVLLRNCNIIQ